MTARALIIAVENYPGAQALADRLDGTNDAAGAFHQWLTGRKGVDPTTILCCGDETLAFRTAGTTRAEIESQIKKLREAGKDRTSELYVFFSGHGFSFNNVAGRAPVDVLVASDFVQPEDSGGACIQLGELQEKLRAAMGPGHHYYFVDACRNPLPAESIDVPSLGFVLGRSNLGDPTWYTLYSTAPGASADVRSGFSAALTDALSGKGRAKGWQGVEMWVTFELLCSYVKGRLQAQEVDSDRKGPGDGRIYRVHPPPQNRCEVQVEGAGPDDRFTLSLATPIGPGPEHQFSGPSFSLEVRPFDYFLTVSHPSATVEQVQPPPGEAVDLYDSASVRFRLAGRAGGVQAARDGGGGAPPVAAGAPVHMAAPSSVRAQITDLDSGAVRELAAHDSAELLPGMYRVKMREHGITLSTKHVHVTGGDPVTLDVPLEPFEGVHRSILERVALQEPQTGVAMFSEMLGATTNRDLGLWLSLLGAARIIAPPDAHSKLMDVPLHSFADARPGDSPVYVLAAFHRPRAPLWVGLHERRKAEWQLFRPVPGMEEVHDHFFPAGPGARLLSFQAEGLAPRTVVVHALPNRATLVTISDDESGVIALHQHVLPIHSLEHHLDPHVREHMPMATLPLVRTMYAAQELFARHREIAGRMQEGDAQAWSNLLHLKWMDPVLSLIAAHELIRTRGITEARGQLRVMVGNLRRHFGAMADVEALATLADMPVQPVRAMPLLLESVLALQAAGAAVPFPLPEHRLDFESPWTSWSAAVPAALPVMTDAPRMEAQV